MHREARSRVLYEVLIGGKWLANWQVWVIWATVNCQYVYSDQPPLSFISLALPSCIDYSMVSSLANLVS